MRAEIRPQERPRCEACGNALVNSTLLATEVVLGECHTCLLWRAANNALPIAYDDGPVTEVDGFAYATRKA